MLCDRTAAETKLGCEQEGVGLGWKAGQPEHSSRDFQAAWLGGIQHHSTWHSVGSREMSCECTCQRHGVVSKPNCNCGKEQERAKTLLSQLALSLCPSVLCPSGTIVRLQSSIDAAALPSPNKDCRLNRKAASGPERNPSPRRAGGRTKAAEGRGLVLWCAEFACKLAIPRNEGMGAAKRNQMTIISSRCVQCAPWPGSPHSDHRGLSASSGHAVLVSPGSMGEH